jgi:hypothetical protein
MTTDLIETMTGSRPSNITFTSTCPTCKPIWTVPRSYESKPQPPRPRLLPKCEPRPENFTTTVCPFGTSVRCSGCRTNGHTNSVKSRRNDIASCPLGSGEAPSHRRTSR